MKVIGRSCRHLNQCVGLNFNHKRIFCTCSPHVHGATRNYRQLAQRFLAGSYVFIIILGIHKIKTTEFSASSDPSEGVCVFIDVHLSKLLGCADSVKQSDTAPYRCG